MEHAASAVPPGRLPEYAARFARTLPAGEAGPPTSETIRGRRLAMEGVEGADVPACAACHGPWPEPIDPAYPALDGQYRPYLETQLTLWRAGARGGTRVAKLMHAAARRLSDADIAALAAYYSARRPARPGQDRNDRAAIVNEN